MIVGELSDVSTLGKGGGHHHGGHHHGGRGFGPGWGPGWWGGYDYGPEVLPVDKFVLVGPDGKGTVVITQIPQNLPTGWTFRRATPAEAAVNKPLSDLGQIPEIISTIVKTGAEVYAQKQAARAQKKAEAEAARQQAMAASRQQALVYAGGGGGGFPWLPVILGGVGVITLGTIGYLLLRKK
jgi:hypothetical protein